MKLHPAKRRTLLFRCGFCVAHHAVTCPTEIIERLFEVAQSLQPDPASRHNSCQLWNADLDYACRAGCAFWRFHYASLANFGRDMTGFPGRNGRRRRVLNEEVRAASTSHMALRAIRDEEALPAAPRYSDAAGVEHHPQITDFVPRRYRAIAVLGIGGLATIAVLVALNIFAQSIVDTLGLARSAPFDLETSGSLADWASAVTMLLASAVCWIIYFLRRHRIDDIRGRYRVWLLVSLTCLAVSANSVVGLHTLLAGAMTSLTGWTALRDNAAWWLALAGVPIVWIAVRATLDAKECRLAGTLLLLSAAMYSLAITSYLGRFASTSPYIDTSFWAGARLLGHWALFVGVVAYARYVILDAQGLIPARAVRGASQSGDAAGISRTVSDESTTGTYAGAGSDDELSERSTSETEWIDGSRPEPKAYDSDDDGYDGGRKLSKADRKRLRKLKDQQRAA